MHGNLKTHPENSQYTGGIKKVSSRDVEVEKFKNGGNWTMELKQRTLLSAECESKSMSTSTNEAAII